MLEMTPALDSSGLEPLYIQLYEYIRQEIQNGTIKPHSKLPAQRRLADHLQVSRNTVDAAYQQLLAEGYIRSEARKGLFVVELNHDLFAAHHPTERASLREKTGVPDKRRPEIWYDFNQGHIDLLHFPYEVWRKLTAQALYADQSGLFFTGDPQGELPLRRQIAAYLYQSRGVRCAAEHIIIGAGTQYMLSLLCMMIGRNVAYGIEEPGFHRARFVLEDCGVKRIPVPLDDYGISVATLRKSDAAVVYVTPSHQFPTGTIMPVPRRMELIEWAKEKDGLIIEDDYDGEFRYQGKPVPSLQGLDPHGNVVYLGTFSKSLIPSIRLSYMVLPPALLTRYHERFVLYKQTVSRLHQHTLTLFMEQGHWERHINRVRNRYKKRRAVLLSSIKNNMGNRVHVIGADAGLHVLLEPDNGMSERELIVSAEQEGVKVYPVSIYYDKIPAAMRPRVLLGFGGLDENDIEEGIMRLHRAWFL